MPLEYCKLHGVEQAAGPDALGSARAKALAHAIAQHEDCLLRDLQVTSDPIGNPVDILVVDITCHGLPSRNKVGILPRERLALVVPHDPTHLVDVLAMREGFPVLIHQNDGRRAGAPSLCLYNEPPEAVLRTWTPQLFIRRIQWWLTESAKQTIHLAEQPVEQLFFKSKYELVLPVNLSALVQRPDVRLGVFYGDTRPDEGQTFFLRSLADGQQGREKTASVVFCSLPRVVNGPIERDPQTLGELADILRGRGLDLIPALADVLTQIVDDAGMPTGQDEGLVVLLLTIPIARVDGGEPERFIYRAFLLVDGRGQLGVAIGALQIQNNRYFRMVLVGIPNQPPNEQWRGRGVFAMDVLRMNDASASRMQSNLDSPGPIGVLVGAGTLGSAMANLWGRSGWGDWTVIDNDHIKPHNLVRHAAYAEHIGVSKPIVIAALHQDATGGQTRITSLVADALKLDVGGVGAALRDAQVVIDASADLEFPRLASTKDGIGRCISTFISPSGNDAVLMVEDAARTIRLRTLEAQYYREIIRQDWGRTHLESNLARYWTGRGCRDISVALPYSRVLTHASTLAEQVIAALPREQASLRIWQRIPETASVSFVEIEAKAEICVQLGEFTVYYDVGLCEHLNALRDAALPSETGGVLLGYFDFNTRAVVIADALSAPPDSFGSQVAFERGVVGLEAVVNEAKRRTADIVGYLGEWHSHPPGYPADPSRDDLEQLLGITLQMQEDGLPALQLIVGADGIRVLMCHAG